MLSEGKSRFSPSGATPFVPTPYVARQLSAKNYMNTILDDISAVIGLSATLKLVAWYGDGVSNLYVPAIAADGQLLPKIIGLAAAKLLSNEWPGQHLHIPRLHNYQIEMRKRDIARRIERGQSLREIATELDMSERRVSQIKEDLRRAGLLSDPVAPAAPVNVAVLLGQNTAAAAAATNRGMDALCRQPAAKTAPAPRGQAGQRSGRVVQPPRGRR